MLRKSFFFSEDVNSIIEGFVDDSFNASSDELIKLEEEDMAVEEIVIENEEEKEKKEETVAKLNVFFFSQEINDIINKLVDVDSAVVDEPITTIAVVAADDTAQEDTISAADLS